MTKGAANPILTIRLNDAEHARFWRLMDVAKKRNAYAGKSDVLRELLELNKPTVLTKDEIHFFRSGEKRGDMLSEQGIPIAPTGTKIPLGEVSQKKKRRAR
jgi:hypothetical protein